MMADKSKIEWTDATWNPVTGCTKVSEGCRLCYAERVTQRWGKDFSKIELHPGRLDQPLRWNKPRMVFVNSMSDLFHEKVPDEFIDRVFVTMWNAQWHTFQVLTKRVERMRSYMTDPNRITRLAELAVQEHDRRKPDLKGCLVVEDCLKDLQSPLPKVWLGVSVENQATADKRIPILLQTPAAVRWVSAEPLLGSVDLDGYLGTDIRIADDVTGDGLDWIVCGGESGPKARPMHPDWARSIRDQCVEVGVPFFFKQWGEWIGFDDLPGTAMRDPTRCIDKCPIHSWPNGRCSYRIGKKNAGAMLDGREWREFPGGL